MNSSVGEFGTATLEAATNAIEGTGTGDATYSSLDQQLSALEHARDALAGHIKDELFRAEFAGQHLSDPRAQTASCEALIGAADHLAITN
ncbi:MAG TPA: hypothetical protein VNF07_12100 [Acidimicrobiales bacterium]|nr:hypothetical protein [Acidimicrobiales bacterium]